MTGYETCLGRVSAYPAGEDQGKVEVQLPALEEGKDTLLASMGQGLSGEYWLPEIGDLVEVAMPQTLGGEPWIMRICRPGQDPQTQACWTENNDRKQLRTRSGHTLTLDDTQDKTSLLLQTAGGLKMKMDDETQSVRLDGPQEDQPFLVLDLGQGTIKLSAPKGLQLICGESVLELKEDGTVTISAAKNLVLQGKNITLKGESNLKLEGQKVTVAGSTGLGVFKAGDLEAKC